MPIKNTVTIGAAGLNLDAVLLVGNLVHVTFVRGCQLNCATSVVVESLETWGGLTNTHPAASGLYVAAAQSMVNPVGAPYRIGTVRLTCHDPWSGTPGCGSAGSQGAYMFVFSDPATSATTNVYMGQTQTFLLNGTALTVRNLESYETGYCDDLGDYAHWAAEQLPAL